MISSNRSDSEQDNVPSLVVLFPVNSPAVDD